MFASIIRFWSKGWIEKLYLDPAFHFHYAGFEFVTVPGEYTYLIFLACGISALFVALGYRYRLAAIMFFLSFTYIELMDKTTYLNHYYFISVLSFVMIWLPANSYFSLDAWRNPRKASSTVPRWTIDCIKVLLAVVYIYAGAAKLNPDWLLRAMPLAIWLPSKAGMPVIGPLLDQSWLPYFFSWAGAIYDLTIVFFLMWRPTRRYAFVAVVFFHVVTRILFPIGMFPFIMIAATTIFFSPEWHEKALQRLAGILKLPARKLQEIRSIQPSQSWKNTVAASIVGLVLIVQVMFPMRSHLF